MFKNINKIDKLLDALFRKLEMTQITKIKNERKDTIMCATDIKKAVSFLYLKNKH